MILIWGSYSCGKTDEVPGLFHVVTRFGHLWYLPLIPLESYVMVHGGDGETGAKIPLSGKSLLLGWGRAGSFVTGVVSSFVWFVSSKGSFPLGAAALSVGGLALGFYLTFAGTFRRASYERAMELGKHLGLNRRGQILLDVQFGRVTEAEARNLLQRSEAEDIADQERELARRKEALRLSGALPAPASLDAGPAKPFCLNCGSDYLPSPEPWSKAGYCSPKCGK